jgi:hypothetical protein
MQEQKNAQNLQPSSDGERTVFWRHMAFRLFLGLWALYSLICEPLNKALITLLVLGCFKGMGETVFASLAIYARLKAEADEERKRQEEIRQRREAKAQALEKAKAAAADKYFEFGMQGKSAPDAG